MKKLMFLIMLVFNVQVLCSNVFADIAVPEPPGTQIINTIGPAGLSFIVDLIVIIAILLVLKQFKSISFKKIVAYIVVIFITGMICDFIGIAILNLLNISDYCPKEKMYDGYEIITATPKYVINIEIGIFGVIAGILLYINNYILAKKFITETKKVCAIIAICMAILTNPAFGMIFFNSGISYIEDYKEVYQGRPLPSYDLKDRLTNEPFSK